jgi:light-regulated signal transduction histidine kinase (bacteriophytochrome)
VEDFVPQVTSKAIELYGRGLPPQTLARVERIAAPLMPAVKDRAREELPRLIREKTAKFENIPFAGMVMGADKYLEVAENGNEATVRSRLPEHGFEVRMTKSGDKWKIVGVRDEKLATAIAQKIGQEIIVIARNGNGLAKSNLKNIQEVLREAQEIFK